MAVRLRLMRMGKKKQPTYRVVAADSRSPRNGRFIEIIGTYQPRLEPSVVKIDNDRAVHWLRHGARPSEAVEKLLRISGAWAEFNGEEFVPPVAPAPKTKSSAKRSEPSSTELESDVSATEAVDAEPEAAGESSEGDGEAVDAEPEAAGESSEGDGEAVDSVDDEEQT